MSEHNILGAILAGGQSKRMGKDKLFLELDNKKLIEHSIDKVKKYLKQVIIITNQNNEFFKKLGIEKLRFKPAYNPYTEPSMEIFSYHEGLKKWVEIGNSGIFRPEMLLPMGLPENVNVIAWGLSLER